MQGAPWSDDLFLLTPDSLAKLPWWTIVTSIMDSSSTIKDLGPLDALDIRYGVTAWGLSPEEWEQAGGVIVRKTIS